ncbi:hypothetical protein ACLF3G_27560 [Falsiroseomonas sp. HC035]|uniref:hypothetical protein n=1 Tax=Falsiroseomonas sp. HC035 TaxID=3390999 RepID=UPI003D320F02
MMSPCPTVSAEPAPRAAPPAPVRGLSVGAPDGGLAAWPLEWVLAAMPPGEALDARELLARLQAGGATAPALCTLQHRLHEGWIEGFVERRGPGRSCYRRIPGVTLAATAAGQTPWRASERVWPAGGDPPAAGT